MPVRNVNLAELNAQTKQDLAKCRLASLHTDAPDLGLARGQTTLLTLTVFLLAKRRIAVALIDAQLQCQDAAGSHHAPLSKH